MAIHVAGRKVYLRQGRLTQTVNICSPENRQGAYEKTYVLNRQQNFAHDDEIAAFNAIPDLEEWLKGRGAALRNQGEMPDDPIDVSAASACAASPVSLSATDANWAREAITIVDAAINELLLEFARSPYLHRVEHSMHARLFSLLCDRPLLGQHVSLKGSTGVTQLLHKEWPETIPRGESRNFDLAVLAPGAISNATINELLEGRIAPSIAIEMGLDYDDGHLLSDFAKLLHNCVPYGRLVHLSRDSAYLQKEEEAIQKIQALKTVHVSYAAVIGDRRRVKLIGTDQITTFSR